MVLALVLLSVPLLLKPQIPLCVLLNFCISSEKGIIEAVLTYGAIRDFKPLYQTSSTFVYQCLDRSFF